MTRSTLAAVLLAALVLGPIGATPASAQDGPGLAGRWTLNRDLSEFPREVGFGVDWASASARGAEPAPGGEPRGGASGLMARPESEAEAKRKLQLTAEVRNPSARLTIVETATTVTIGDDRGRMRTFHPDGRDETVQLDGVPVVVNARRDAGRLVLLYRVAQGRDLRYTFSRVPTPAQLVVDVQFVERGGGDRVRRVYEPAPATDPSATPGAPPTAAGATPAAPSSDTGGTTIPAQPGRQPGEAFDQRPDAALRGLTRLGVVVEDLGAQAVACGLNQDALETMVATRLSEAGFRVARNSDEDTYVYVNIMSGSLPGGLCVSRYDVSVFTHTTATLSYQDTPVLAEVKLLHKGGIAGGSSAAHGATVLRGVQEYLDGFVKRIRDANR